MRKEGKKEGGEEGREGKREATCNVELLFTHLSLLCGLRETSNFKIKMMLNGQIDNL